MFSTGSHRSESKSSIITIQTRRAPLAKSDSVFEEKLHACRTKIQQIRMNFTTKPSDHNQKKKKPSNRTLEMKRKSITTTTEWKKKTHRKKKFSNHRRRDRIEIERNSENLFQRKMNQKASKHSRLFEEKEKEKRGFWNLTFVERERD